MNTKNFYKIINVGGELLLGGAYSDSVFKANSDFSDLYTSICTSDLYKSEKSEFALKTL